MFSAFAGPPRIARLFGTGTAHEFGSAEYARRVPPHQRAAGSRAVIVVQVHKVGTVRACRFLRVAGRGD